jgi:hypothetical protein
LVRPGSVGKPEVLDLKAKGIHIKAADLDAPESELAQQLQGQDVVIAAISIPATMRQISLANAAKAANVKRFVPCFFAPVAAPKGVVDLRDKVGRPQFAPKTTAEATNRPFTERRCLQSCQEVALALHDHRCRLVVPIHVTKTALWTYRLCPQRFGHTYPWRRQCAVSVHRQSGYWEVGGSHYC